MLSNNGRLRLEHVRIARSEFGLPDDFEYSVILKYPQYFRLIDAEETRNKYIECVEKDKSLMVCGIEKLREKEYRERGGSAEDMRFSFIVNFHIYIYIYIYCSHCLFIWALKDDFASCGATGLAITFDLFISTCEPQVLVSFVFVSF